MDTFKVKISKDALKDLKRLPHPILEKLNSWISDVENCGLLSTHNSSGIHDEPLHGQMSSQRSIRLNRSYRAIYSLVNEVENYVVIDEVSKHHYH